MSIAPLRTLALVLLVLVTGATSVGCTASAAGKGSTAEMPAPAADPTAPPADPVIAAETSWSEFLDWATDTTDQGSSILGTFTDDASAYDVAAVEGDARSLSGWAGDARSWLAQNPPDACYAAVHASYDRSLAHYQKAGSLLMNGVTAKGLTAATAELKLGNVEVARTTALIKKVTC